MDKWKSYQNKVYMYIPLIDYKINHRRGSHLGVKTSIPDVVHSLGLCQKRGVNPLHEQPVVLLTFQSFIRGKYLEKYEKWDLTYLRLTWSYEASILHKDSMIFLNWT